MNFSRPALILSVLAATALTLRAQAPAIPECDMAKMSMVELGNCLDKKFAEADIELNRVYQATLKVLDAKAQAALRNAQRGWIVQRDADVTLLYSTLGGNHPSIEARPTEILLVRQRIAFLKALAQR